MNDLLIVTDDQRSLVQKTIAPDATPMELDLFFYDNKRRGVHPLDRLIHFTKRNGRYVPITSIHFMRSKADEGGRAGQDRPAYAGKEMMPDYECAVTVYKLIGDEKVPYIGVAKWKEYAPDTNSKEGFMWRKMPSHMIAKCAEANALRLGFPRELAGLHIEEEVHVLDETVQTHEADRPIPLSLKDKLKAQIEQPEPTPQTAHRTSQDAPGGTNGPMASPSSVHEPTVEESEKDLAGQAAHDAPESIAVFLDQLALVQSPKELSEVMNDALKYSFSPTDRKTLQDHKDLAMQRLKGGKK